MPKLKTIGTMMDKKLIDSKKLREFYKLEQAEKKNLTKEEILHIIKNKRLRTYTG